MGQTRSKHLEMRVNMKVVVLMNQEQRVWVQIDEELGLSNVTRDALQLLRMLEVGTLFLS